MAATTTCCRRAAAVSNVNLNATYSEQYNWNDANRDLVFQPGEQTGTPVITSGTTTISIDPDYQASVHRRILAASITSCSGAQVERGVHVSPREERPGERRIRTTRMRHVRRVGVDPGLDGLTGTADDGTFQYFERMSTAVNRTLITNDPTRCCPTRASKSPARSACRTAGRCWRATRSRRSRITGVSVNTNPNNLINVEGAAGGPATSAARTSTARSAIGRTSSS